MPDDSLTLEDIIVPVDSLHGKVDWTQLFGNDHPVELEIGTGKGTFLINAARVNPQINYLGIEWANKYYKYAADRARRWNLPNVRMLRCDARDFVISHLPSRSLQCLHVYFPDPWPKKRHHKRRLFNNQFVAAAVDSLIPDGCIHVVTDVRDYFQLIKPLLARCSQLQLGDFTPRETAGLGEWVGTNFERKYLAEGRTIYSCSVQKIHDHHD
ncbi:MAG: tRNA (guanosine(46)-N7)-methyltransferase TrmB [Actinobacteria bacterium]|nr:tRNA (guanosine(46)-N7)-methyltransferase TrmB [Actinomycetota bacterium]